MSQPAARIGDRARSESDTHLVNGVPQVFTVTGEFTQGSESLIINSKGAVRQGDGGTHASCIGPNTFYAVEGSATIFADDLPCVRDGDPTYHCSDVPGAGMGEVLPFCSYDTFLG